MLKSWFEIKVRARFGGDKDDDKQVTILGRTVTWNEDGTTWEADTRHREKVLEFFGVQENSNTLMVNGDKETAEDSECAIDPLAKQEARDYRGLATRINFLSLDWPSVQVPDKECAEEMSSPKKWVLEKVKESG